MNEDLSQASSSDFGNGAEGVEVKEAAPTTSQVQAETKAVCFSKALIYVVLTIAALTVSVSTFFTTFNAEEDEFESDVRSYMTAYRLPFLHSI